jgi:hypothetical protein
MEDASTPTAKLAALSVGDARRLTASFRGREMQGLRVTLPAGFVGAVLRPPLVAAASAPTYQSSAPPMKADASRAKKDVAAAKARAKRASRRAKHTGVEAEPEEQAVPVSEEAEPQYLAQEDVLVPDEEKDASRVLRPTATFGVFTLWNPDIAVDEGKDEYLRSLTEWVDIAAEVRRQSIEVLDEADSNIDPSILALASYPSSHSRFSTSYRPNHATWCVASHVPDLDVGLSGTPMTLLHRSWCAVADLPKCGVRLLYFDR